MDNFVWAKMKNYSAWPAKICEIVPDHIPKPKRTQGHFCVFFYGTNNYGWISKENLKNYSEFEKQLAFKNKTKSFRRAIEEIEEAINIEKKSNRITLKNIPIEDIISTFTEHFTLMEHIFTSRSKVLDRLNSGYGLDYCSITILYLILTPEQQQKMFLRIVQAFTKSESEYIQNPIHENLFWTTILPEWAIAICINKFSMSKSEILKKIKQEDTVMLNESNFELSV